MVLLKTWLEEDQLNRHIFDEENELWQEASVHTKLEHYKTDTAWTDLSAKLGFGRNRNKSVTIIRKNNFRILIAAASLALLVAAGSLVLLMRATQALKQAGTGSTIVSTNEGEKARIVLPDSTKIILNSGSKLIYNGRYDIEERKVKFCGEAFFDVATNPEKPFVVQLGKMNISATGTRFNVFSFINEDRIETTLEEGAITVSLEGRDPVKIRSGQQIIYFTRTDKLVVRDVATDTYTSWKENKLRLNDTPFEEALRRIARKYNVVFEITNRNLLDLKYTATFIDESIEEVMQMLKAVSPITYKIDYRTTISDKQYTKPRIVVGKRRS
jgi:ferric-dicitrate binding protein FerR (iron transport regulator)